jgi:putative membrane protein
MNSSDKVTNKSSYHYCRSVVIIIFINHFIGLLGLNSAPCHSLFEKLTSINMLLSFILVIVFQRPFVKRFFIFFICAFMVGMAAEIAGVNTGRVFGSYYYTPSFGWQFMGVPVIIGVSTGSC